MIKHMDKWGYFYADRYGLIGHDSADVAKWLAAHPEFSPATGDIWFDYGTGEDQTECTSIFFPEPDDVEPLTATVVAGSVNLLDAVNLSRESAEGRVGNTKIENEVAA